LAGAAAAAAAYLANCLLVRRLGPNALWLAVPAVEEALKSSLAVALGAPLVWTHLVFGSVEAAYELRGRRRTSPTAAGLALVTHTGFGGVTAYLVGQGSVGPAIAVVATLHSLFNMAIVRRSGTAARRISGG
jgi:hypothetical protein